MNILEQCVVSFEKLFGIQYHFEISKNRNLLDMIVEFEKADLKHLIGLQYLKDVRMPRSSEKVFDDIKEKKLKYEVIEKSPFFHNIKDSNVDVSGRIHEFPKLAEYIENDNIILKYIKKRNPYSRIEADYMIESTIGDVTVFIFLRAKRNGNYCVCSFFPKKNISYTGERAYWMLKEKIDLLNGTKEAIYQRDPKK